jgi:hypothetical protein
VRTRTTWPASGNRGLGGGALEVGGASVVVIGAGSQRRDWGRMAFWMGLLLLIRVRSFHLWNWILNQSAGGWKQIGGESERKRGLRPARAEMAGLSLQPRPSVVLLHGCGGWGFVHSITAVIATP